MLDSATTIKKKKEEETMKYFILDIINLFLIVIIPFTILNYLPLLLPVKTIVVGV